LSHLSSVRVWIGSGDQDPIIAPSETQRLVSLLRGAKADVTIRFFEAGHGLTNEEIEIAGRWLKDLKQSDTGR
jgi:phospholipase/carboxylesterase